MVGAPARGAGLRSARYPVATAGGQPAWRRPGKRPGAGGRFPQGLRHLVCRLLLWQGRRWGRVRRYPAGRRCQPGRRRPGNDLVPVVAAPRMPLTAAVAGAPTGPGAVLPGWPPLGQPGRRRPGSDLVLGARSPPEGCGSSRADAGGPAAGGTRGACAPAQRRQAAYLDRATIWHPRWHSHRYWYTAASRAPDRPRSCYHRTSAQRSIALGPSMAGTNPLLGASSEVVTAVALRAPAVTTSRKRNRPDP
jgi:hypothetical protein